MKAWDFWSSLLGWSSSLGKLDLMIVMAFGILGRYNWHFAKLMIDLEIEVELGVVARLFSRYLSFDIEMRIAFLISATKTRYAPGWLFSKCCSSDLLSSRLLMSLGKPFCQDIEILSIIANGKRWWWMLLFMKYWYWIVWWMQKVVFHRDIPMENARYLLLKSDPYPKYYNSHRYEDFA